MEGGRVTKPCRDCRRRLDLEGFCLLLIVCLISFWLGLYFFGQLLCDCSFNLLVAEISVIPLENPARYIISFDTASLLMINYEHL